jgi:hypothetical protein
MKNVDQGIDHIMNLINKAGEKKAPEIPISSSSSYGVNPPPTKPAFAPSKILELPELEIESTISRHTRDNVGISISSMKSIPEDFNKKVLQSVKQADNDDFDIVGSMFGGKAKSIFSRRPA